MRLWLDWGQNNLIRTFLSLAISFSHSHSLIATTWMTEEWRSRDCSLFISVFCYLINLINEVQPKVIKSNIIYGSFYRADPDQSCCASLYCVHTVTDAADCWRLAERCCIKWVLLVNWFEWILKVLGSTVGSVVLQLCVSLWWHNMYWRSTEGWSCCAIAWRLFYCILL